ncbi:hypothetical protein SKAU_G00332880 [Synaphobranchus kaupii]|uniref:Uncharacterized protein n=1 Tax=Synaphobranchus kaupii TaxID=118154 RepID=A0A9Q1IIF9_SYNKA|nr:hypothetical protein SKAU_G00332880 [Synaphobranchus kaupii]
MSTSVSLTSLDSTCTITAKESRDTESLLGSASLDDGEGEEEEDEEEEDDDEEVDKQVGRKRSDSSPPDPCQLPRRLPPKRIENPQNVEMTLKMKDAISGRIRFFRPQQAGGRANKQAGGSPVNGAPQWTEEEAEQPAKRPQTAAPSTRGLRKKPLVAKERRSRSAESLRSRAEDPTLLELERTQKDLSQRLERMGKGGSAEGAARGAGPKRGGGEQPQTAHSPAAGRLSSSLDRKSAVRPGRDKAASRRHSSGEHGTASEDDEKKKKKEKKAGKGPLRATPPPGTPPSSPHQPSGLLKGRNSVKRLIDTFSQGLDEKRSQRKLLAPLRGVRKCGVPVMPGLGDAEETPDNSPNSSSCRADSRASDRTEDLDLDSLPPPPLEVLMDTSFESAQGSAMSDSRDDVSARRGRSVLPQRMTVTQRLRASMQAVTVLPSRSNLRRGPVSVSPVGPACHNAAHPEVDPESEEAANLYKQARKIIHLRHSAEPPPDKPQADSGPRKSTPTKTRAGGRKGGSGPSDTVPSTAYINSQPPATPP